LVFEPLGVELPNRALLWKALIFWWAVFFAALMVRRIASLVNP